VEATKLHPVAVLVRDHLPQQRDLGRRVQKDGVGLVRGLLHPETVCRVVRVWHRRCYRVVPHLCPFVNIVLGFESLDPVGNLTHRPTEQCFRGTFAPVFNRRCLGPSREQLNSTTVNPTSRNAPLPPPRTYLHSGKPLDTLETPVNTPQRPELVRKRSAYLLATQRFVLLSVAIDRI